jgi:hypothetical protein
MAELSGSAIFFVFDCRIVWTENSLTAVKPLIPRGCRQ